MTRSIYLVLAGAIIAAAVCGNKLIADDPKPADDPFEKCTYRADDGCWLPYRLLKPPKYDPSQKYPVLLWLHGAGGRGIDNVGHQDVVPLAKSEFQEKSPCFVVAPQCPMYVEEITLTTAKGQVKKMLADTQIPCGPKKYIAFKIQRSKKLQEAVENIRNIRIYEAGQESSAIVLDFSKLQPTPYATWFKEGHVLPTAEAIDNGKGIKLTGTQPHEVAIKYAVDFKVTPKTIIELEVEPVVMARNFSMIIDDDEVMRDCRWVQVSWEADKPDPMPEKPSYAMALIPGLIESLRKEFPAIDPQRVYVGGHSMGAFGALDAAARYPGLFAAVVPVAGGGDTEMAKTLKDIPMWAFHGTTDPFVPYRGTRNLVDAVQKAGGDPKFTSYQGEGHMIVPKALAEPGMLEWLMSQKKGASPKGAASATSRP